MTGNISSQLELAGLGLVSLGLVLWLHRWYLSSHRKK